MAIIGIDTQLVTVTVDAAPGGTPAGVPAAISCVMGLGDYNQTRNTTKYECMSSDDSLVGLGSVVRDPLTFEMLYNELGSDGQEILKTSFETNSQVQIEIEFNNKDTSVGPTGAKGTTLSGIMGVQAFAMPMPKDGKVGANFTLEFMGTPTLDKMVPGTA